MIDKTMYSGLIGLWVSGENYKRDETKRCWAAKATGAARKGLEIMIEVIEKNADGKYQKRWLNLGTFTGNVGPYRFEKGKRIDKEKSEEPLS